MNDLNDLVSPEAVLPRLVASSRRQVLQALSECLAAAAGLDARLVFEAVLMRERLSGTGVGDGVALPHATLPGLKRPVGAFARAEPPQESARAPLGEDRAQYRRREDHERIEPEHIGAPQRRWRERGIHPPHDARGALRGVQMRPGSEDELPRGFVHAGFRASTARRNAPLATCMNCTRGRAAGQT